MIAITTGGRLGELASRDGVPVIGVPGGISPRAATGFLFIPTLRVLQRLGLLPDNVDEISEMIDYMRALQKSWLLKSPRRQNRAKQLAQKLFNRIPVIWGFQAAQPRWWPSAGRARSTKTPRHLLTGTCCRN